MSIILSIIIIMESFSTFIQIPPNSDFSIQNIPFGVFSTVKQPTRRPCTRIGDTVIDLKIIEQNGLFDGELFAVLTHKIFAGQDLNTFMSLDRPYWIEARQTIQRLFTAGSKLYSHPNLGTLLHNISEVQMHLPAKIGDYTDFYSSKSHAFNVGSIIRGPANALQQNWLHIPIGYHGRSSSIVVSGANVIRPRGQIKPPNSQKPLFSACKRLDFEIEIGFFVGGKTNELGHPLKVNEAWNNIFGLVILNDWSFRDFQTWEYVPLGPFTAKNGITTISPWIVTLEALKGTQVQLQKQEPEPFQYLRQKDHHSYDINLVLDMQSKTMTEPQQIVHTNMRHLYWTCAQQLTHHSVSGCNMRPGDLLGTGTISGEEKNSYGSLLELTWGGKNPFKLGDHDRVFIEDGDKVTIRGWTNNNGARVGFGECSGTVLPALDESEYY